MAEAKEVQVADYYQCTAGLTVGMNVCQEGEVIEGSAMGFNETNPPLSEEEQVKAYGQVMYTEYDPDEEELGAIQLASRTIRALSGMRTPDMPPVSPATGLADAPLFTLSRQELRAKAKKLGLNFPEDTDRDQMIGAIEKKQSEAEEGDEDEPEVVTQRRQQAKEAIEKNNELATGGAGAAAPTPRRSRSAPHEAPAEQEET